MYNQFISSFKTMGDVDVLWHDGVYHLFHLVLPNHDFIAHAISHDGLNWQRIENALFIGDPGRWDDFMLWTMHVSADPHRPGQWRMFYTGLSLADQGQAQRIGLARSSDLVHWTKEYTREQAIFEPLASQLPHYEAEPASDHAWVSFRDPFYYRDGDEGYLLMSARVPTGPTIRRGCAGLAREVAPDRFELAPPVHHPGQYDDVEVPNLLRLNDQLYLIGSIREDAKIRYWYADSIAGPWNNYFDNVLLAGGNYAGRISWDAQGPLLWNFYTADASVRNRKNLMPPPKRIVQRPDGRLATRSFEAFDDIVTETWPAEKLIPIAALLHKNHSRIDYDAERCEYILNSDGGFQGFLFAPRVEGFRLRAKIRMNGSGKCGFLFRIDPETSDGYYLSLDLRKGVAQLRAWGHRHESRSEEAFRYSRLQAGYWQNRPDETYEISLLAVNSYIEFALDGYVLLSLADETFTHGHLGAYVESANLVVENPALDLICSPTQPSDTLPAG